MDTIFRRLFLNPILFRTFFVLFVSLLSAGLFAADLSSDEAAAPSEPVKGGAEPDAGFPSKFSRDRKGIDVPLIDETGNVVFASPEEKSLSEMNEEDFYKTLTPAEKVLLASRPETAPELIEAAVMVSRVGRIEFAKILAEKALAAEGAPEEYADLIDRLGEEKLMAFSLNPVLNEIAAPLVKKAAAKAAEVWQSPESIRAAFEQTSSNSPELRAKGLADLKRGYPVSLNFLLDTLNSDDESSREQAGFVLTQGGIFAAEGMLAQLRVCGDSDLSKLAAVLARSPSLPEITPILIRYYDPEISNESRESLEKVLLAQLGAIPSREEGARRAYEQGMAYYDKKIVLPNTIGGEYPIWISAEGGKSVQKLVSTETALRHLAAQTLYDAWLLNPDSPEISAAAQIAVAEEILYHNGLDAEPDLDSFTRHFPDLTPNDYESALQTALETNHDKGGIIPALLLGESQDFSFCVGKNAPTPLVRAAVCRDRRLRFAALKAITDIAPSESFFGSSGVTASLIWFTTSLGKRHAILAAPDLTTIGLVGNYISEGGIQTVPAGTGRDILVKAQNDADVEFVIALSCIEKPDLRTTAQTLAADFRTFDIPMMLCSEDDTRIEQARRYGEGEPNVLTAVLPFDKESGSRLVSELFKKTDPRQVPAEIRLLQAKEAVQMLRKLRETGGNVFHIEDEEPLALRLLETPVLSEEGIAFAQTVPSKAVQLKMGRLIFSYDFNYSQRQIYLDGLKDHIARHGLLLRGPDLLAVFNETWPEGTEEFGKELFRLIVRNASDRVELALSIPASRIQFFLGDLAEDLTAEQTERQVSLNLFRRHIQKYGLLLSRDEIQQFYDRYNATEDKPQNEQELAGILLDAIEEGQAVKKGVR